MFSAAEMLKNASYLCPGLHEKGARQLVEPRSLEQFLTMDVVVQIPLFQRRYCWTGTGTPGKGEMISTFLADCLRHGNGHRVGKIIVKREEQALILIDGQQRTTTACLLLMSLRDSMSNDCAMAEYCDRIDRLLIGVGGCQSRVVPSLADHELYLDLLFKKAVASKCDVPMVKAKRYFDACVAKMDQAVKVALFHSVSQLQVMYVEILTPIDYGQVFLWFQEKSTGGEGSLLWNPSPGVDFHCIDLVRNLIFAPFMNLPRQEQLTVYRASWWEPFESRLGSLDQQDQFIVRFIESKGRKPITNSNYAKISAVQLYYAFSSIYEEIVLVTQDRREASRRLLAELGSQEIESFGVPNVHMTI